MPQTKTRHALSLGVMLLASLLGNSQAQTRPVQSAQVQSNQPAPYRPSGRLVTNLSDLIANSQQIVYFTPSSKRIDIAETLRKAITGRGTELLLITDRNNFWTSNSLTLRLMYMGAKTYDLKSNATPYMLLDGTLISGPGLMGAGNIYYDPQHQTQVANWTNRFFKTHQPLKPENQTAEWIRRANLGPNPQDLPPKPGENDPVFRPQH